MGSRMGVALKSKTIEWFITNTWYFGLDFKGCFSDLINVDEVGLCCSKLPMLYENSPINEKGVLFRSLPFAIRTALCGQFLYYR